MTVFAERLRKYRALKSTTQKQVAEAIGISERGYQEYELSRKEPTMGKLIALADYFDVSLDYLVGRSDDPARH